MGFQIFGKGQNNLTRTSLNEESGVQPTLKTKTWGEKIEEEKEIVEEGEISAGPEVYKKENKVQQLKRNNEKKVTVSEQEVKVFRGRK